MKKQYTIFIIPLFLLAQKAQKKKLGKKKTPFFMGSAQTRKLLKKLDQNFYALESANISCSTVERTMSENKRDPIAKFFEDGGVGEGSFLLRKSLPPRNILS